MHRIQFCALPGEQGLNIAKSQVRNNRFLKLIRAEQETNLPQLGTLYLIYLYFFSFTRIGSLIARYLNEKPSEIDLDEISKEVGEKWRSLLTHLGIPLTKIKSLYENNHGNPTSTCFEGLHFWREGNEPCKPATWSVLLTALEKGAEKKDYACTRREELLSKESSPSNQGITCKSVLKFLFRP